MAFLEKATDSDMVFLEKENDLRSTMTYPKVTNRKLFAFTGNRNSMSHTLLSGHSDMKNQQPE